MRDGGMISAYDYQGRARRVAVFALGRSRAAAWSSKAWLLAVERQHLVAPVAEPANPGPGSHMPTPENRSVINQRKDEKWQKTDSRTPTSSPPRRTRSPSACDHFSYGPTTSLLAHAIRSVVAGAAIIDPARIYDAIVGCAIPGPNRGSTSPASACCWPACPMSCRATRSTASARQALQAVADAASQIRLARPT